MPTFPASLSGQRVVLPTPDSSVRHEFEHYCKRHNVQVETVVESQDVMVQKLLAMRGVGLTVMPEFAIQEYLGSQQLRLIGKLESVYEDLFLISATRKIENPVAARLMKRFKAG